MADDWPHGTLKGYYRHRNRHRRETPCEPCRAAWAEYQRQRRNGLAEEGLPPGDPRHGTAYGYSTFNCRCGPCTEAGTAYARKRDTAVRGGAQWPDPHQPRKPRNPIPHGTPSGYINHGCRCDSCRTARTAYDRDRRGDRLP